MDLSPRSNSPVSIIGDTRSPGSAASREGVRGLLFAICLFVCAALAPRPVIAQASQVGDLVDQASNHYDNLEIDRAKQKLNRAIEVAKKQGISGTPVARAHVMAGVVIYGAKKDKKAALEQFKAALKQDPEISVPDVYRTPTLEKVMKQAKESVDTSPSRSGPDPGPRRDVDEFTHEPISSARAGESLVVETFIPPDMSVGNVVFYYKRYDQTSWSKVELKATNATRFATEVPGYKIYTSQVAYYIEAVDPSGQVVATSGEKKDPHSITVLGSASFDPEEAKKRYKARKRRERKQREAKRKRASKNNRGGAAGGGSSPKGGSDDKAGKSSGYIEFGGGTGAGFVPKHPKQDGAPPPTENPNRALNPGLAPAFAHVMLGGGHMIDETSSIGGYLRFQFAPEANLEQGRKNLGSTSGGNPYGGFANGLCLGTGLPGDCMLGVKYRRYVPSAPDLDLFVSVGGGVGRLRQWVRLKEQASNAYCSNKTINPGTGNRPDYCYRPDTVRPGFLHVGGGGGFAYAIGDQVSMMGEAYLTVLFPDTTVNLDVNVGPHFRF